jgi:hypothetical protein
MFKRFAAAALVCVLLAACTTTSVKMSTGITKPAPGARILLLEPDISLSMLTTIGGVEPRADWSQQAQTNMTSAIEAALKSKSHAFKRAPADASASGQVGQLFRLHEAVGQSILMISYGPFAMPTKAGEFDWTLGEGAQALGRTYEADYALFVFGRGTHATGGRVAAAVGMSLLGVSVPLGQQQVFASLVELKTGRVVWFGLANAGPSADMRETAGAGVMVTSLLKDLPL